MESLLLKFKPGTSPTHQHLVTKALYEIPFGLTGEFWLTYLQSVHEDRNPYLAEVVSDKSHVQLGYNIHLIFNRDYNSLRPDVYHNLSNSIADYVKQVIRIVQRTLNLYFNLSVEKVELCTCYLSRKELLKVGNNQIEFYGRIVFPWALVQRKYVLDLYQFVIGLIQSEHGQISQFLALQPINGLDTLLQPINLETSEMLGSSPDNESPLLLKQIYGEITQTSEMILRNEDVFDVRRHLVIIHGLIAPEVVATYISNYGLTFFLPLMFSSGYTGTYLIEKDNMHLMINKPQTTIHPTKRLSNETSALERARAMLGLIDRVRVDQHWSWFAIGQALFNISSDNEALKIWEWKTTQSDSWTAKDCQEKWLEMNVGRITEATIEWFAYKDDPELYRSKTEKDIRESIMLAVTDQLETSVAKAFKALYPFEFVCSDYATSTWYYYERSRWIPDNGNYRINYQIIQMFQPELEKIRSDISQKVASSRDAEFKARNETVIVLITQLIRKLGTTSFKNHVCSELRTLYYNPKFRKYSNSNPNLTGTENGVIDLTGEQFCFRQGIPEDYITLSTNINFPINYTWETEMVKVVITYMEQVFRNQDVRDYFWRLMGKLLYSGNIDKIFPILTGSGDNSKSMVVRLIEAALGSYCRKLPITYLTEIQKDSNRPNPFMIATKGAKVVFAEEPNVSQPIQSGTVKYLTGNDTNQHRDMYQGSGNIEEFLVSFVPFLVTNKIPDIPDCQQAIWQRTRVLEFLSRWSNDAPDSLEEQYRTGVFKMNRFFEREIPKMAPAFLWIMTQMYDSYIKRGMDDPPEVLQATENFRIINNKVIGFLSDIVERVLDADGNLDINAKISLDELYQAYTSWYRDQQYNKAKEPKMKFKENIESIWKQKASNKSWFGYRLKFNASINAFTGFNI